MSGIGILAYGSLVLDPGREIEPLIVQRIPTQTPFPVEYARYSRTRGGAPTLVPHLSGKPVSAEILMLNCRVSLDEARNLLWRRETGNVGTGGIYQAGTSPNSVVLPCLTNFHGIDHVIYTDFHPTGKVTNTDPSDLTRRSIASVQKADIGKDGMGYLIKAIESGIKTTLTDRYVAGILHKTGAASLRQALSWLQAGRIHDLAKAALGTKATVSVNPAGYVPSLQDNLVPGVRMEQFEEDLRKGRGNELRRKFCAVHSSSALAVNTFAPFKDEPGDLILLGKTGFSPPTFEHGLPSGLKGTPPTLDIFFKRGDEAVAIESKLLEYIKPKKAKFAPSYVRSALPWAEDCWWHVLEGAKQTAKRHLDVAQLVKHYFGVRRLMNAGDLSGWKPRKVTLLYLFWEPEDAAQVAVCQQHYDELIEFSARVASSVILFRWQSYPDLWKSWANNALLCTHTENLRRKYMVRIIT